MSLLPCSHVLRFPVSRTPVTRSHLPQLPSGVILGSHRDGGDRLDPSLLLLPLHCSVPPLSVCICIRMSNRDHLHFQRQRVRTFAMETHVGSLSLLPFFFIFLATTRDETIARRRSAFSRGAYIIPIACTRDRERVNERISRVCTLATLHAVN